MMLELEFGIQHFNRYTSGIQMSSFSLIEIEIEIDFGLGLWLLSIEIQIVFVFLIFIRCFILLLQWTKFHSSFTVNKKRERQNDKTTKRRQIEKIKAITRAFITCVTLYRTHTWTFVTRRLSCVFACVSACVCVCMYILEKIVFLFLTVLNIQRSYDGTTTNPAKNSFEREPRTLKRKI